MDTLPLHSTKLHVKFRRLLGMFAGYKTKQYRLKNIHLHGNAIVACTFVHLLDESELLVKFEDAGSCLFKQARLQLFKEVVADINTNVKSLKYKSN